MNPIDTAKVTENVSRNDFLESFLDAVSNNPQGMLLFLAGSFVMTTIHLVHRKEIIKGHKGLNGLWEPAEWTLYWFSWICPYILIGAACGVMTPPAFVWYFLGFMLVYGFMGNKGVEAILAWRGVGTATSSSQSTSTTSTQPSAPDTTNTTNTTK